MAYTRFINIDGEEVVYRTEKRFDDGSKDELAYLPVSSATGEYEVHPMPLFVGYFGDHVEGNARTVLEKRYLRRDSSGEAIEDIKGMFFRIAKTIDDAQRQEHADTRPELEYLGNASNYYQVMSELKFLPNSPTFTGAGTPLGQLAACFVLPISDDMGKDEDGIFSTLRAAALIQQTGGGNGFDFSSLRPRNSIVGGSSGIATGPVGFLKVYDAAFGEIAQGGTRRGANMAVLRVDHPDIEEFIDCKLEEGSVENFNISVGVTDMFMRAALGVSDPNFDLIDPKTGDDVGVVDAPTLFAKICENAHRNGEPGILFLDQANAYNPVPNLYDLRATNPCGEQWLGPYENCCLGSINLAKHLYTGPDGETVMNWGSLARTVNIATNFLDGVVTANKYVPAIPQVEEAAMKTRRIGLGIMGLADAMYRIGIAYNSAQGTEFARQVMEFIRYHCMKTSCEIATVLGPFHAIEDSIYDPDSDDAMLIPDSFYYTGFKTDDNMHTEFGVNRSLIKWVDLEDKVARFGIRNAAQTTIAPTGTISTVAGCEGYGCEPVFALGYTRNMIDGASTRELSYVSEIFRQHLESLMTGSVINPDQYNEAMEIAGQTGSCQDIDFLPDETKRVFVTSRDISPGWHVSMQSSLQEFVDNSISKTCNFPSTATVDDVMQAYEEAWRGRCKGLTVYVEGSRDKVVLETQATKKSKEFEQQLIEATEVIEDDPKGTLLFDDGTGSYSSITEMADGEITEVAVKYDGKVGGGKPYGEFGRQFEDKSPPCDFSSVPGSGSIDKSQRPYRLQGSSYKKETPLGTAYITVNKDDDGEPFEVFINIGKAGSNVNSVSEAIGRLLSLLLRVPSKASQTTRLVWAIDELKNIGSGRSLGFGKNKVLSLPDGLAHVLTEHVNNSNYLEFDDDDFEAVEWDSEVSSDRPKAVSASVADICPECGNFSLINTEGCKKCYICGYSEC